MSDTCLACVHNYDFSLLIKMVCHLSRLRPLTHTHTHTHTQKEEQAQKERQEQRALKKQQEREAKEKARGFVFPTYETVSVDLANDNKPWFMFSLMVKVY